MSKTEEKDKKRLEVLAAVLRLCAFNDFTVEDLQNLADDLSRAARAVADKRKDMTPVEIIAYVRAKEASN